MLVFICLDAAIVRAPIVCFFVYWVMDFIKGGDTPKEGLERVVYNFKRIIDWSAVNLPRYNPYQFELARHLDGRTKAQTAKAAGMSTKRYSDIEKGNSAPTPEEVTQITMAQSHVIETFFEQWHETEIDWSSGCCGRPVAIDYYKYKVFRDINKPRLKVL